MQPWFMLMDIIKEESLDYKRNASIIQFVSPGSDFENEGPFTTDLSVFLSVLWVGQKIGITT